MTLIRRIDRASAAEAYGVVIVIDVIRAFSVAGYAFAGGARKLWLVRTTEEALALRTREPDALLAGEVGGRLIPGFDLNNSPSRMATANIQGRLLIQRTGAGTQGAVNVINATHILLGALTNAQATVRQARILAHSTGGIITLFPTATIPGIPERNEDEICADYIEALLHERDDAEEILTRGIAHITHMQSNDHRSDPWQADSTDFPLADIPAVLDANRFDFAMLGSPQEWQEIRYIDVERVP